MSVAPDPQTGPTSQRATLGRAGEIDQPLPQGNAPSQPLGFDPADPKSFQTYLNQLLEIKHPGTAPLQVDGIIGPKTMAVAQALGVPVPDQLAPKQAQPAQQGATPTDTAPAAPADNNATPPAPAQLENPKQWIADNYPDVAPYLNIPEVGDILVQWAQENGTPVQLKGMIEGTDWFKNTSEAQRTYESMQNAQPGQLQSLINNKKADIKGLAQSDGVVLSDGDLTYMATQAVQNGWDENFIQGQIRQRPDYMGVSKTERDWNTLVQTNPGEAAAQRTQAQSHIGTMAARMGVRLDGTTLASLAEQSLMKGWTEEDIRNNLASQLTESNATGAALTSENDIQKTAKDWGFNATPGEISQWLQSIANGTGTIQDYAASLQQRALQVYGSNAGLADAIQKGVSPGQFFKPYASMISNELGTPQDSLDWTDPKYMKMLNYIDPKTGVARPMNIQEAQQTVRSDPTYGWKYSQTAGDLVSQMESKVLQTFGDIKQ